MFKRERRSVKSSPGRAGGRGSETRESLVLRMVVASQRSKAVLRVAERSDSIMLRSSSAVKDPATSHRTLLSGALQGFYEAQM